MQTMKVLAEFGGWQVALNASSIVLIRSGDGQWNCDHASAYDAIVAEVKDKDIRRALLNQWGAYMNGRAQS